MPLTDSTQRLALASAFATMMCVSLPLVAQQQIEYVPPGSIVEAAPSPPDNKPPEVECCPKPCGLWARLGICQQPMRVGRLGSSVACHRMAQVVNGLAAQQILYRYDFYDGLQQNHAMLKPRGRMQLSKMVRFMQITGRPIVIEGLENEGLNEKRKQNVLTELNKLMGQEVAPVTVVIQYLDRPGLDGGEAELIHANLLKQTEEGGTPASSGFSSGGIISSELGLGTGR